MNLLYIDKEFNNLQLKDQIITHIYEPKIRIKGLPRHTYYNDLKKDFVNEINVFKFSPYIQMNFTQQQKNEEIRKHVNFANENNFLRFVKLTNVNKEVSVVANKSENLKNNNKELKTKDVFINFIKSTKTNLKNNFSNGNKEGKTMYKSNSMMMKLKTCDNTIKSTKGFNNNKVTNLKNPLSKSKIVSSISSTIFNNEKELNNKKYYLMNNKSKNIQLASLTSTNKQKKEAEKQNQNDSQNKNVKNNKSQLGVYEEKLVVKRIREELDSLKAKLKSKAFVNLRKIDLESLDEV